MPWDLSTVLLWGGFFVFVVAMLALDLFVFQKDAHQVSLREGLIWTGVWIALALVFNLGVFLFMGPQAGMEFATGYFLEKALSVDNLFVFLVIFQYFAVPQAFQHRVLFWGILGALVMRLAFILAGGAFLAHFSWAIYVFGGILGITGLKLMFQREDASADPGRNPAVRLARRFLPVVPGFHGARLFVRQDHRLHATPLFLCLVAIETSDVIFAVDSVPAVLAVTRDTFIVFTSNVFAILGLRSLYFVLSGVMDRFRYLKPALSLVLILIAAKMMLSDVIHVPIEWSLGAVATILGVSILLSWLLPRKAA